MLVHFLVYQNERKNLVFKNAGTIFGVLNAMDKNDLNECSGILQAGQPDGGGLGLYITKCKRDVCPWVFSDRIGSLKINECWDKRTPIKQ